MNTKKVIKVLFIVLLSVLTASFNNSFSQYLTTDDFDGDGIINSIDLDDDNDGLTDIIESSLPINKIGLNYTPIGISESQFVEAFNVKSGLDNKSTIDSRPRIDTRYWSSNYIKLSDNGYFRMVMNTNEDIRAVVLWNQFPFYNMLGRFNGGINPPCGGYETQAQYNKMGKYMTAKDMDIVVFYNNGTIDTLKNIKTVKPTGQDNVSHSQVIDLGKTFNDVSEIKLLFKDYWVRTGFTTYVPLSSLAPTYSAQAIIFKLAYIAGEANDLDVDGDNIYNRFDYDSDGDSVSDAKESGLTSDTTLNYKFPINQVGTNGLFDSLEFWDNQYEFLGRIGIAKNYKEIATIKNNPNPDLDNDGILGDDIDFDNDGVLNVDEGCTKGGRGLTQSYISHMSPEFWCETSCGYPTIYGIMVTQDGRKIDYRYTAARTSTIFLEGFTDMNVDIMGGKTEYFEGVYPKNGQQNMGFIYMNTLNCNPNSKIIFSEPIANLRMYVNDIGADPTNYTTGAHYYEDWAFNQNINIYKPNYVPGYSFTVLNSTTLRSPRYGAGTVNLYNATDSISWVASKTCYGGSCSGLLSVATGTSNGSYTIDWGQPLPSGGGNYGDYNCTLDTDGDGIPNALDLDSDNDGCSDAYEAGATKIKTANYQFDNNVGTNGLHNTLETNDTYTANYNYTSYYSILAMSKDRNACSDTDLDSVANIYDIDDDNDGVLDFDENTCLHNITNLGFNSPDNTYQYSTYSIDSNNIQINSKGFRGEAIYSSQSFMPPFELEYTVSVLNEFGFTVALNPVNGTKFGYINSAWDLIADKYKIYMLNNKTITYGDKASIANGFALGNRFKIRASADIIDYYKSTDNGVTWNLMHTQTTDSITAYNIGVMDLSSTVTNIVLNKFNLTAFCNIDTDNDGVQNSLDLDSDGDGCSDALEAGSTNNSETNYMFPPTIHGENGLNDTLETTDLSNAYINYISTYKPNAIDSNISNCCTLDSTSLAINVSNTTNCTLVDGKITFYKLGLILGQTYIVSYDKNGITYSKTIIATNTYDPSGELVITGLDTGYYSNFVIVLSSNSSCKLSLSKNYFAEVKNPFLANPFSVYYGKNNASTEMNCNDGKAWVTVTGGNSPYSYEWKTIANSTVISTTDTAFFSGLSSSSSLAYIIKVTDSKGCNGETPASGVITCVNNCDAEIIIDTIINNICENVNDGIIKAKFISSVNSSKNFTIWVENNNSDTIFKNTSVVQNSIIEVNNLPAGSYTYKAKINDMACPEISYSFTIAKTTSPLLATIGSIKHQQTINGTEGEIKINVSSGYYPYSYSWTPNSTNTDSIAENLLPGTYNVVVSDSKGCKTDVLSATISYYACNPIVITNNSISHITCYGLQNGSISNTVSGGTGSLTFIWDHDNTINTKDLTNLKAGNYKLTISDAFGCSSLKNYIINAATEIQIALAPKHINCYGDNSGNITTSISGGTGVYSFLWSNGQTTQNIVNISSGEYQLTVTDGNSCKSVKTTNVTQPQNQVLANVNVTNATNPNCNDGIAWVMPTGGTEPYSILWSDGTSNDTIQNLTGTKNGTIYTVTVTDAQGCTGITPEDVVVKCFSDCDINLNIDSLLNVKCTGDSSGYVRMKASSDNNSSATFNFEWKSNGLVVKSENNVQQSFMDKLPFGVYEVKVRMNGSNCQPVYKNVIISEPNLEINGTVSVLSNVTTNGGSDGKLQAQASGGTAPYTYTWLNGQTGAIANNLTKGEYCVIVSDANACQTDTVCGYVNDSVCSINPLKVSLQKLENITCNGLNNGIIDVVAIGGKSPYSYLWSNNSTDDSIFSLSQGNYEITITDDNGCKLIKNYFVNEPSKLSVGLESQNILCNGEASGIIKVNSYGGNFPYNYTWSNGSSSQTINNLTAGYYSVNIVDNKGCNISKSTTLTQPLDPMNVNLSITNSTMSNACIDGIASVGITGGISPYKINWSTGATTDTIKNLFAADTGSKYSVTVTDANGCNGNTPNYFVLNCDNTCDGVLISNYVKQVLCKGNSTGEISVTAKTNQNLDSTFVFEWINESTNAIIKKDSAVLVSILSNLPVGKYKVRMIITGTQCSAKELTFDITEPTNVLSASLNVISHQQTVGGSEGHIQVVPTGGSLGGYTYSWDSINGIGFSTSDNVSNLLPGNYCVTVKDSNNCVSEKQCININSVSCNNVITLKVDSIFNITCFGSNNGAIYTTVVSDSNIASFIWTNSTQTTADITNLSAGTYSLTVTDIRGCKSEVSGININEPNLLISSLQTESVKCSGNKSGTIDASISGGTSPYKYYWNDGDTNQDRIALKSGVYSLTTVDKNMCSITKYTTVTEPSSQLNVNIISKDASNTNNCNDGRANAMVIGGISPYQYLWSNGSTTDSAINLFGSKSGEKYTLSVMDANGCVSASPYNIVIGCTFECDAQVEVDTIVHNTCKGNSNGYITVTGTSVSNPTSTYKFEWYSGIGTLIKTETGVTSSTLNNLSHGSYLLKLYKEGTNCFAKEFGFSISEPSNELMGSVQVVSNQTSVGGNEGSLKVLPFGGTPPYTFMWDANTGNASTQQVNNLMPGKYCVSISDSKGCVSANICNYINSVNCDSIPKVLIKSTEILCNNNSNGSLSTVVVGGSTPYTYLWNDASSSTTSSITSLSTGIYTVTVTDNKGCKGIETYNLKNPTKLSISLSGKDISCNGDSTGYIDATVIGGTLPYTYSWNNGTSTEDNIGLKQGIYTLTVTDKNNCSASSSKTLSETTLALSVIAKGINSTTSSNCNDGIAWAEVNGGTKNYVYYWLHDSSTSDTIKNLSALTTGTIYKVIVRDANGCFADTQSMTLSCDNDCDGVLNIDSVRNVKCKGDNTGYAKVKGSSLKYPSITYIFEWDINGIITIDSNVLFSERNNLFAGTYKVKMKMYGTECLYSEETVIVSEPNNVLSGSIDLISNQTTMGGNEGQLKANPTGGTAPYTYMWDTVPGVKTTQIVNNLYPGTYCVIITDSNACVSDKICSPINNFNCTNFPTINSNTVTDITCNGDANGKILLNVTGGTGPLEYKWSNNSTIKDLDSLSQGTYSVDIKDSIGCITSKSFTINEPSKLSGSLAASNVKCSGQASGDIDLSVSGGNGGNTYMWSNNSTSQDIIGLTAGNYSVIVKDSKGCSFKGEAIIDEPSSKLTININTLDANYDSNCANGQGIAIVSGGIKPYTYLWKDTSGNILSNNSTANNLLGSQSGMSYTLTVIDANGCKGTSPENIIVDCNYECDANILLDSIRSVSCKNGSDGGIIIKIKSLVNPLSKYKIVIYDELDNIINQSNNIDSIKLNGLYSGLYKVKVIVMNSSCDTIVKSFYIPQPTKSVSASITVLSNQLTIAGTEGKITVAGFGGSGNYTYLWGSNAGNAITQTVSNLLPNTYCVTVTDKNGCASNNYCDVINPVNCTNSPNAAISIIKSLKCNSDNDAVLKVNVIGGAAPYTYSWNTGSTLDSIVNIGSGFYSVTVMDNKGCKSIDSKEINQPSKLSANLKYNNISCNNYGNGFIDMTIDGGSLPYSYLWNTGSTSQDLLNIGVGEYSAIITDANSCKYYDTAFISEPSSVIITSSNISSETYPGLNDGKASANVIGGTIDTSYTYIWYKFNTSNNSYNIFYSAKTNLINGLSKGNYKLVVLDANKCSDSILFVINGGIFVKDSIDINIKNIDSTIICIDTNELVGNISSISICDGGNNSNTTINGENCVIITPNTNYVGPDTLCIVICDDLGYCDTTIVKLKIQTVIDTADVDSIDKNDTTKLCIDTSQLPGNISSMTVCNNGNNITALPHSELGCFELIPDSNFIGRDTLCFVVCDDMGYCDTTIQPIVVINIGVGHIDTLPVDTVPEGGQITICDTEIISVNADSVLLCNGGENGISNVNGNCVTYKPDTNYVGKDTICIIVCNDGVCDTNLKPLVIIPVGIDTLPVDTVLEDSLLVICDTTINNGTIADSLKICNGGEHGTTEISSNCITYKPNSNYIGRDTICVITCNDGICDTNILPLIIIPSQFIDTMIEDTVPEDSSITICDTDINGVIMDSISICNGGEHGTTAAGTNCITYKPNSNYIGRDTLCVITCNDGVCDTTIIPLIVTPFDKDTLVVTVPEDSNITVCDTQISSAVMDSLLLCSDVTNGEIEQNGNCITYTPNSNYFGKDSLCVITCNDGVCDTGVIIFVVTPDTTTENRDTIVDTVPEDSNITICDTTINGGAMDSLIVCGGGNHGNTISSGNCVTYTPVSNYIGKDTICVISCNDGYCDTSIITVLVIPFDKDTLVVTVPEDSNITVCDTQISSAVMDSLLLCSDVTNGEIEQNGNCITYTPNVNYIGKDSLCVITCNDGVCDTGMIIISVVPNPNSPFDTIVDTVPEDSNITFCDTDFINAEADSLSICNGGNYGVTEQNGNCITYTPNPNFSGNDTICVIACNDGFCDTTIITLFVFPKSDTLTFEVNQDTGIFVLCFDSLDSTNSIISFEVIDGVGEGVSFDSIPGTNCVNVNVSRNYVGNDTLIVVTCYAQGYCDTIFVVPTVKSIKDTMIDTLQPLSVIQLCSDYLNQLEADSIILCSNSNTEYGTISTAFDCFTYTSGITQGIDSLCLIICNDGVCDTTIYVLTIEDSNEVSIKCMKDTNGINRNLDCIYEVEDFVSHVEFYYGENRNDEMFIKWQTPDIGERLEIINDTLTISVFGYTQFGDSVTCSFNYYIRCNRTMNIPEFISPNGDDYNDTWDIPELEKYPKNTVKIFNRYGKIVYEKDNYLNHWSGESQHTGAIKNDSKLPTGTYFYVIDLGVEGEEIIYGQVNIRY